MVEGSDYRPPRTRAPTTASAGAPGWATTSEPSRDPLREPAPVHRDVPRNEGPPATPGPFWILAGAGIALLCLAHLIRFFAVIDDIPDDQVAAALFAILGVISLAIGLALAAILARGVPLGLGLRVALLLGAGYFATNAAGWANFLGIGLFG
jgi:hypothetical protein